MNADQLPEFDIVKELADAWAEENRENLEYHLHPLGEEGMSDKGGCSWKIAWAASGRPVPKKEGERAFTGAMDVGRMHHAEVQRKLVPRLKRKYPGLFVGPIISESGEPEEIYVGVKMFDGAYAYSPLDLCIATAPGFVKVRHQFKNGPLEVWELAPGAEIIFAWDIKSANAGSFYYKQKEPMSYDHEAQFTGYMAAAKIPKLPALYVNKDDGRSFVKICPWDPQRWQSLIDKRKREKALTEQLRDPAAKPKVCEQDFHWYNPEMKGLCLYCAHAKVREQLTKAGQPYAKPRFELVGPCTDALRAENQTLDDLLVDNEGYGNPANECMKCHGPGANPGTGQCKKCDDADDIRDASANKKAAEQDKPALVLPPPDFTDEEAFQNIEKTLTGPKCIVCKEPCEPTSRHFCAKHGPKISDTVGL